MVVVHTVVRMRCEGVGGWRVCGNVKDTSGDKPNGGGGGGEEGVL